MNSVGRVVGFIVLSWLIFAGCELAVDWFQVSNSRHFMPALLWLQILAKVLPWLVNGLLLAFFWREMVSKWAAPIFLIAAGIAFLLYWCVRLPWQMRLPMSMDGAHVYGSISSIMLPTAPIYCYLFLACFTLGCYLRGRKKDGNDNTLSGDL
ncbi:MAG: hypothetical protein Q4C56_03080 [Peptococcaceae bacterium]|nr:hypothetical protein [Peptococcaceae bacterium]